MSRSACYACWRAQGRAQDFSLGPRAKGWRPRAGGGGSWGGVSNLLPTSRGSWVRCELPAGFVAEPRPPKGFPLFSVLRHYNIVNCRLLCSHWGPSPPPWIRPWTRDTMLTNPSRWPWYNTMVTHDYNGIQYPLLYCPRMAMIYGLIHSVTTSQLGSNCINYRLHKTNLFFSLAFNFH